MGALGTLLVASRLTWSLPGLILKGFGLTLRRTWNASKNEIPKNIDFSLKAVYSYSVLVVVLRRHSVLWGVPAPSRESVPDGP